MPFPIQEAFPIFILISRRITILACELAFKLRIRERKSRKKESRREWMRRERRGDAPTPTPTLSPLGNFILQYLPGPSSRPFQPEPVPGLKQLMLEVGGWGLGRFFRGRNFE